MDVSLVKSTDISSTLTQTDLPTSPILRQCLCVIKTVPEFQNLAYRVTKTQNDVEVLVVYREGVSGVFGPPVDPITLTFDPKGRCLMAVLFKPVQRVSVVSRESSQIELTSLLTVLRMIAGKGYLFCPGLPERFVTRKACGKLVVFHRVPFKRYQSVQCPVYYHAPGPQPNSSRPPSLCALCPKCMQAARLIQTLPTLSSSSATNEQQSPQLQALGQLQPDEKKIIPGLGQALVMQIPGITSSGAVVTQINNILGTPASPSSVVGRVLSVADFHNTTVTSAPADDYFLKNNLSRDQQISSLDVNANTQTSLALKGSSNVSDLTSQMRDNGGAHIDSTAHILKAVLKNFLQEMGDKKLIKILETAPEIEGVKSAQAAVEELLTDHPGRSKQPKRNLCRHCKKQFSSPANLLNHLQRHEALSSSLRKRLRIRRSSINMSPLRVIKRGFTIPSHHRKVKPAICETWIKLFLKYLKDMTPSNNGAANSVKNEGYSLREDAVATNTKPQGKQFAIMEQTQNDSVKPEFAPCEQTETEVPAKRAVRKRSGLSPMQTLLHAAAIAEVGSEEVCSPTISSSSSASGRKCQEPSVVSTTSHSPIMSSNFLEDSSVPSKKTRTSSRLASKRARNKRTSLDDCETAAVGGSATSHDPSLLTNLNLLSTVSLETAMRQAPTSIPLETTISSSIPTMVLSPEIKTRAAGIPSASGHTLSLSELNDSHPSHSVNITQQVLHNTSGGNVMISRTQDKLPLLNTHLYTGPGLLPLSPVMLGGSLPNKDLVYPLSSQKQHVHPAPVLPSSSLRTPAIHNSSFSATQASSQPNTSSFLLSLDVMATGKNHSASSDCGAMDLTKPKLLQPKTTSAEKNLDFTVLPGFPQNVAQMVSGKEKTSELLQYLLMMAKTSGISATELKDSQPISGLTSNKGSDSDFQARMFASARNYKIDKGVKSSPQVQAIIASSSRAAQPGKVPKTGLPGGMPTDEIQCSYKWSGSGGLVKERTQMVRELVPPDVLASFLARHQSPVPQMGVDLLSPPQPTSLPQQPNLQPQQLPSQAPPPNLQPQQSTPQPILTSGSGRAALSKFYDLSSAEHALNLIVSKPSETEVSKKGAIMRSQKQKPLSSNAVSSPPSSEWSSTSPSFSKSILRFSLTSGNLPTPPPDSSSSPHRLPAKAMNFLQMSSPSQSSVRITSTPPSNCSISSPSLAAMLRKPATLVEHSSMPAGASSTAITAQQNSVLGCFSVLSPSGAVRVKAEPQDLYVSDQGAVLASWPVKSEQEMEGEARHDANSSPKRLVVDIHTD